MVKAILLRLSHATLSVFALSVLVFMLLRLTGNPINFLLTPEATPEQRAFARQEMGLDQPVPVQFVVYVSHLVRGDLGMSFRNRVPVSSLIAQRLPNTLILGAAALLLVILVAVPMGIYSAYWRGRRFDNIVRFGAALGQSMPSFWLGLLLILIFAVHLKILPAGGSGGLQNLILPAVTLSVAATAGLTRLLRSSMIETLGSDFVLFHRVKGVPERQILWKHALRNAGLTSLSFVGILTARLFTGSILVETVFVWPGMGRLMIEAIEWRDFNVVQGVMLLFAVGYIIVNLFVDLLYAVLNPRLR